MTRSGACLVLCLNVNLGIITEMMKGKTLLLFKLILLIGKSLPDTCDDDTSVRVPEGNVGQISDFNWLGVLHVYLHDGRIIVSGIVLIKVKYALVSADDVGRIPERVFKTDSRVIFLVAPRTPWYVVPSSYVTHPEYGRSTFNSIAIIELNLGEEDNYPVNPICLPLDDASIAYRHLYLTGLTNKNQKLEKVIYEIHYAEKQVCEKYYGSELSSPKFMPSAYVCGYAPNIEIQCVWDNGMALVSNATGYFNLIGFGVGGPGCAAPARFIHLFQYFQWIDSIICPDQIYDTDDCRRREEEIESVPIHALFAMTGRRQLVSHDYGTSGTLQHHIVERTKDDKSIHIAAFNGTWEKYEKACTPEMVLTYKDDFKLKSIGRKGVVTYKLALYDLTPRVRSCVRLSVDCDDSSGIVISLKEGEPPEVRPKQILKFVENVHLIDEDERDSYDYYLRGKFNDSDLYITIEFMNTATLKFELYAAPEQHRFRRPRTTTYKNRIKSSKHKPFWGVDSWAYRKLQDNDPTLQ